MWNVPYSLPMTDAFICKIQDDCLADDIEVDYEAVFCWSADRLRAYFDTAGESESTQQGRHKRQEDATPARRELTAPVSQREEQRAESNASIGARMRSRLHSTTDADDVILPLESESELLSVLRVTSLSHLAPALVAHSLSDSLQEVARDRVAFMVFLRESGVSNLAERQKLANVLSRLARDKGLMQQTPATAELPLSYQNPIVVQVSCGLCNRLRAVLSHRLLAAEAERPLVVLWEPSDACPGHFVDLFEPLDGVHFVPTHAALHGSLRVDYFSSDFHPQVKFTDREGECFRPLVPLQSLRRAVEKNIATHRPTFVAVHVRRTDHGFSGQTTDEAFAEFINRHSYASHSVFVATDNAETQAVMTAAAGTGRVQVGSLAHMSRGKHALRHSSLFAAVVDLYTCAAADVFKGSFYSSFSDTILHIRALQGRVSPSDEHILDSASVREDRYGVGGEPPLAQWHVSSEAKVELPIEYFPATV